VQADDLQTGIPQIIVAMITSQMFRAGHPIRVIILLNSLEGQQSGLLTDSYHFSKGVSYLRKN